MANKYTQEQRDFIARHVVGLGTQELTDLVNARFGTSFTRHNIKTYKHNHGLSSGLTGRFCKGHVPANKGKKMSAEVYAKAKATMFQKAILRIITGRLAPSVWTGTATATLR